MPRPRTIRKPRELPRFPMAVKPILYAIPAYGRTYPDLDSLLTAWNAGKDFKISGNGPYFSIRDKDALRPLYDHVEIAATPYDDAISLFIALRD